MHAHTLGNNSIWYAWTAPRDETVVVDTYTSNFDTLLCVYTGSSVSTLTKVVSDDDAWPSFQSEATFDAVAGTTYMIAVDGYNGGGHVAFHLRTPDRPANDDFETPLGIAGASGKVQSSNAGATTQVGEPRHAGVAGGRSVWFSWTAPAGGTATFDTAGTPFDTLLAVYTGTRVSALTQVAANDDHNGTTSLVSFTAVAGRTYLIAVDGYNRVAGPITLSWTR